MNRGEINMIEILRNLLDDEDELSTGIQGTLNLVKDVLTKLLKSKDITVLPTDDILTLVGNCQNKCRLSSEASQVFVNLQLQPTKEHAISALEVCKHL